MTEVASTLIITGSWIKMVLKMKIYDVFGFKGNEMKADASIVACITFAVLSLVSW